MTSRLLLGGGEYCSGAERTVIWLLFSLSTVRSFLHCPCDIDKVFRIRSFFLVLCRLCAECSEKSTAIDT